MLRFFVAVALATFTLALLPASGLAKSAVVARGCKSPCKIVTPVASRQPAADMATDATVRPSSISVQPQAEAGKTAR